MEATIIKSNIKAQTTGQYIAPIVLMGSPGSGKSTKVASIAKELGMSLLDLSGATISTEQWLGLPSELKDKAIDKYALSKSTEHRYTQWSVPEVIYQANSMAMDNPAGAIILIDDVHAMQKTAQDALYELLLNRKLQQYKLLPNVAIIATANDSTEAGFDGFGSAIINRMQILKIQFNPAQWYETVGIQLHRYVSSFLKLNLNFLQEQESTETPYGTPRSWDFLSTCLNNLDDQFIQDNILTIAKQYVSSEAATELASHVAYLEKINFRKILDDKKPLDISKLSAIDQIVYPFILDWAETIQDAVYCIDLMNLNKDNHSFIGFSAGKFWAYYQNEYINKKPITIAQSILLDKILDKDNIAEYKLSKKDTKLVKEATFEDRPAILTIMNQYII